MSRPYDRHDTFYRLWEAIETLASSSGKDGEKLESLRCGILVFTDRDFDYDDQKKLYKEIREIYRKYPHWSNIKYIKGDKTISLESSHWQIKKKLKIKILNLFYSIIRTD